LPGGITVDIGTFSTAVREGGVDFAGEGLDSLADTALSETSFALFARGTSSSSSSVLLKNSAQLTYEMTRNKSRWEQETLTGQDHLRPAKMLVELFLAGGGAAASSASLSPP
jgi:hypothetical protein